MTSSSYIDSGRLDTTESPRLTTDAWFDLLLDTGPRSAGLGADIGGNRASIVATVGHLNGHRVVCAAFDFRHVGCGAGAESAERIAAAFGRGGECDGVILVITDRGGVLAQEALGALLLQPRVVAARDHLAEAGKPLLVVVADPYSGGIASGIVAMADVILVEPGPGENTPVPEMAAAATGLFDQVVPRERLAGIIGCILDSREPPSHLT